MDGLIYTIMSGADRTFKSQQVRANNITNANTVGFRADIDVASSAQVPGAGFSTRYMVGEHSSAVNTRLGSITETGRNLDVAINGEGYLTVQTPQGEAYTRSGNLVVDRQNNLLMNGFPVVGENGPIVLPEFTQLTVETDGSIMIQAPGDSSADGMRLAGKLKLVKPLPNELKKDTHGLLVTRLGGVMLADPSVTVLGQHLEGSNVSAIEQMIATMTDTRHFEMQMKLYSVASGLSDAGNRVIRGG